jgi:DNA-directed RNA polymerase subunit beta'
VLARVSDRKRQDRDITGGLPRVAELFEARRPKDHAIIAEIDGTSSSARTTRTSAASSSSRRRPTLEPVEYLIPKGKHVPVQEGDFVEKGDYIIDGNPAPHDILAIKGVEALAAYLVNEIQDVYRLQGVPSTTSTSR